MPYRMTDLLQCRLLSKDKLQNVAILSSIVVFHTLPMTDTEKAMVNEMSELIKDQNEKIRIQDDYIKELQQEMADMENKEYDC